MQKQRLYFNVAASAAFLLLTAIASAQVTAYNEPQQPGNQGYTGNLGIDFDVVQPILVTSLGFFDGSGVGAAPGPGGDGVSPGKTIFVGIFTRPGGVQVGLASAFVGTNGTLIGGSRFLPVVPGPILLPVGSYSVVAVGFSPTDQNGNATAGGTFLPPTTSTGGGLISFPGTSRYDAVANPVLSFPTTTYPSATVFLAGTFQFAAVLPLTITKAFSVPFFGVGSVSTLTLTVTNPNAAALTGVAFNDFLPAGLLIASVGLPVNNCGGGLTATAGTNAIQLLNGTIGASLSCTITVPVVGTTPGVLTNTTSGITSAVTPDGTPATAQITVIPADAFQVRYASNLAVGDSVINLTNSGASSTVGFPTQDGNICVNAYVFSPDEQLISCCSCLVTPDGLASLSARNDLISNTLTPAVPTSIAVKLIASAGTVTAGVTTCDASTVTPATIALASGLSAWGTTIHASAVSPGAPAGTFGLTETAFSQARLSAAELTRVTTLCGLIKTNGSGFGICRSCRLGGLGADKK